MADGYFGTSDNGLLVLGRRALGDGVDLAILPVFSQVVSEFDDVAFTKGTGGASLEPSCEADKVEVGVATGSGFTGFGQVPEADDAAFPFRSLGRKDRDLSEGGLEDMRPLYIIVAHGGLAALFWWLGQFRRESCSSKD